MKQIYLKSLLLMLMMCVGMGAWATANYTLTPSAGSNNSYTGNCDVTVDGIIWNVTGNAQMTPWRLGGKSITNVDRTVYSKTAYKSAVSKVDLTVGAASSITVNSLKLVYSTNSDFSNSSEISKTFAEKSTISFEGDFPANAYYKFVFNVTVSGSNNKFVEFSKVEFYNKESGGDTPAVTAPTLDVAAGTYTEDKTVKVSNYSSKYTYAYTTDGTDPKFDENLDVSNGTAYDNSKGIEITSSCTLKVIAVDQNGNTSSITSAAYVINKPQVFASLEELVAADLVSGTNVTVSFENVAIKDIFVTQQDHRNGVYFDIQKGGKDIEIYYQNVPEEWVAGGILSGTMTCPWTLYNGTWELAPTKDSWAWTELTYIAPVQETITSLAVSGTPTKMSYYAGDKFETAGLVVTGTYSDGTSKQLTEGVEWTIAPETLTLGTTSVEVMAGVGSVVSEVYTVNGINVTKPDFETVTYVFSSFTSDKDVELTNLDGFVITLAKGEGSTNPAWSSNQARVYAKGSLTVKANNAIIKSIEYEYTVNANSKGVTPTIDGVEGKTNAGTWDAENKTWTGADEEVTFSTSGTAGNIGFTKLIIKYVEGSKTETSLTWSAPEAEVTINAEDNVFPTLTTTPADLTGVTFESCNTKVATIAEDGTVTLVAAGTTTITARFAATEEFAEASPASYTLTVNNAPFVPTTVEEGYEVADLAAKYSVDEVVSSYQGTSFEMTFAKPQSSSTPTKYYANGEAVRAYTGNTISITAADPIKNVLVNYVSGYVDDSATTDIDGKGATVTFSKTCRFTSIVVVYANPTLTIGSTGYATYYNSKVAYEMPEGCTGSTFTVAYGLEATYKAGDVVPAGEPLVITGTAGAKELVLSTTTNKVSDGNDLEGTDEQTALEADDASYFYALSLNKNGENVGFYWMNATGAAFTNGAHKAYLKAAKTATSAKVFTFDKATAIKTIATATDAKIFDLTGREVKTPKAGIYVVNGVKKYIK